jgi:Smg protein
MYNVLVYLFENCQHSELAGDRARVARKLSAAGFEDSDISEALTWLAGTARSVQSPLPPRPVPGAAYRTYAARELAKLNAECRGLLIYFEQSGILTPQQREHVLERALAASDDALAPEQLKLIVLMVLWNQESPRSRLIVEELLSLPAARIAS